MSDRKHDDEDKVFEDVNLTPHAKIEQMEVQIKQMKDEIKQLKKIGEKKEKLEKLEREKKKIISKKLNKHRRHH